MKARIVGLIAVAALLACGRRDDGAPVPTPLPTKQTTIEPVNRKLESAREEAERRRQQADDAYK